MGACASRPKDLDKEALAPIEPATPKAPAEDIEEVKEQVKEEEAVAPAASSTPKADEIVEEEAKEPAKEEEEEKDKVVDAAAPAEEPKSMLDTPKAEDKSDHATLSKE